MTGTQNPKRVLRPLSLHTALLWRKETGALLFAGGTDLMVRHRGYTGTGPRIDRPVLFLDAVEELRGIRVVDPATDPAIIAAPMIEIGAGCVLSDIESHPAVPELLQRSIGLIAAPGLRNRATLAGNICNASPAGDSPPPLFVLDAAVVLESIAGERVVPIGEFITGPGTTILRDDEIVTAIRIPVHAASSASGSARETVYYRKVGTRAANALSKLSGAGIARFGGAGAGAGADAGAKADAVIVDFRLALGAVAPVIVRVPEVEAMVTGRRAAELDPAEIAEAYAPYIRPISDQRSTAAYRKLVALNMVQEFVAKLQEKS